MPLQYQIITGTCLSSLSSLYTWSIVSGTSASEAPDGLLAFAVVGLYGMLGSCVYRGAKWLCKWSLAKVRR